MKNTRKINRNKLISNSAITFIALIITIIVLLILAAITLNLVLGDNGIIEKAIIAKQRTNEAQELEEQKLKDLENITSRTESVQNNSITKIEFSALNVANTPKKIADYPNGFNKDNTIVVCAYLIDTVYRKEDSFSSFCF